MKKEKELGWTWNECAGEVWSNCISETKEDAIKDARATYCKDEYRPDYMYVGRAVKVDMPTNCYIDSILEGFCDDLEQQVGGDLAAKWWEGVSPEDHELLDKMLSETVIEWAKKTDNFPKCYKIVDIEQIEL